MDQSLFNQLLTSEIEQMCQFAIEEDLGGVGNSDITAELISADHTATARLITRENGILCGTQWVEAIFRVLGDEVKIAWNMKDGDRMSSGQVICELSGNARQMLTGERSAMNFLQSLSATATLTNQYVKTMNSDFCRLLDTRKTIPGMRFGQKYAVTCGGGSNHRIGLSDAFLIKENHIMACGGIRQALEKAICNNPDKLLEIEVESINELQQAIDGRAQVIMLDNFSLDQLRTAKAIIVDLKSSVKLEASGNVNLTTIADIASTGVDYISVGALTKDVKAIDLSLRIVLESK